MSYAMPPQPAKRGKPWTLIIGGVLTLLALLLCCGGGIPTVSYASDLMEAPTHHGSHTVQLDEGESIAVWAEAGTGTTSCSVNGPSGPVSNEGGSSQSINVNDRELERAFAFDAPSDGSYTIACTGTFVVGDSMPMAGVIAMGLGGALCCISVVVLIIGLVLWLNKRKN